MNARLVANIPLMQYDEKLIPIRGLLVTFEAIDHVEDCRLFLKKNWRDYAKVGYDRGISESPKPVSIGGVNSQVRLKEPVLKEQVRESGGGDRSVQAVLI